MEEGLKKSKNEKIMIVVLIALILLFVFVVIFVIANKNSVNVNEEENNMADVSKYVEFENVNDDGYSTIYKNVNLKKVIFKGMPELLVTNFYTKQNEFISTINGNINANKQFIDKYNSDNNITDYTVNSEIDSIVLFGLKDKILSVLYLIEDSVDYVGLDNYITNIFIDVNNNQIVSTEILLDKYNMDKDSVSSLVFDYVLESHNDKIVNKDTKEEQSKESILNKKEEFVKNLVDEFDTYVYLYVYNDSLYLKYNKSDIANKLFNEELKNVKYSTLKLK